MYEEADEAGFHCVVIKNYSLPLGYQIPASDLLIRLPPGFPDAAPDMWWFDPAVRIAGSGTYPPGAEYMEPLLGRTWQRFSRHLTPAQWRPGRSGIQSYLATIRRDLARTVGAEA